MTLCYYVTGHGFGHAIRTAQVLKALPADMPIIVKTTVPERLFREELRGREFRYIHAEYDCGCVQPDSVTILKRESLDRYAAIAARNRTILSAEASFLRDNAVSVVVTDISPFPLEAAQLAGIPAIAATNFTWYDIYKPFVETAADESMLAEIAAQYGMATVALISGLHTPTTTLPFPVVEHVPLTARKGVRRRTELDTFLNGHPSPAISTSALHIGLLYMGTWGLDIDWDVVERIPGWRFVTYDALPRPLTNVTLLSRDQWIYADVVASVDAVISKVGYGTVTDSIANSVPQVHLPRRDFVEYDALVAGMDLWGGRVEMSEAEFIAGQWDTALASALNVTMNPNAFRTDGAEVIARRIVEMAGRQ
ncbi:MAG TPA: hypothetical protein VGK19_01910 [Capsulimonadaceae bacterium]|jgi:L-arabinokinase